MSKTVTFLMIIVSIGWGCKSEKSSAKITSIKLSIPTIQEDEVIARCSPWLADQIDSDVARQQNEVVNYIIDKKWDLQMGSGGIFYHIIAAGEDLKASWGTRVSVHYNGYDLEGNVFDSSYKRAQSFKFYVGNVIPGWNQALPLLGKGGKAFFLIPAYLAYADEGFMDLVPPGQHLIFYIELIEILD
ncbi:MAG: hypothetical protein HKN76_20215 [Saprospiraceae bacterium]|nr:hypothetical protein [Saprospiraceae bacterium]